MFFIVEVDNEGFKVFDSSGNLIDPATNAVAEAIRDAVQAISNSAGVKKIVDALPVGDNVIGRVKLTDGTSVVAVVDDGGIKRLRVEASLTGGIAGGLATEATLASLEAKVATETTLASIKDTDGIKKITDPLPAGTNEIGKVAQGTKAAPAGAWPVVLYDAAGNPVAVTLDGSIYRLSTLGHADQLARDRVVGVDYYQLAINAAASYYLTIDVSNLGGAYKHAAGSDVVLYGGSCTLIKSNIAATWDAMLGVIVSISGASANIVWIDAFHLSLEDTSGVRDRRRSELFPIPINLAASLPKLAALAQNVPAVNTGVTLPDVAGVARTPAQGDIVTRVRRLSGAGNADLHQSVFYEVV